MGELWTVDATFYPPRRGHRDETCEEALVVKLVAGTTEVRIPTPAVDAVRPPVACIFCLNPVVTTTRSGGC